MHPDIASIQVTEQNVHFRPVKNQRVDQGVPVTRAELNQAKLLPIRVEAVRLRIDRARLVAAGEGIQKCGQVVRGGNERDGFRVQGFEAARIQV